MSTFCVNLDHKSVANQVVNLINCNNKLKKYHTWSSISSNKTKYLIELAGYGIIIKGGSRAVIGCIGLVSIDQNTTLIKHLSIHKSFRKKGIATKLINEAIKDCKTSNIIARIRTDNNNSLRLCEKFGFVYSYHENLNGYSVLTVILQNGGKNEVL